MGEDTLVELPYVLVALRHLLALVHILVDSEAALAAAPIVVGFAVVVEADLGIEVDLAVVEGGEVLAIQVEALEEEEAGAATVEEVVDQMAMGLPPTYPLARAAEVGMEEAFRTVPVVV